MTVEPDVLARIAAYHGHIAVPPAAVADDVRRGRRRVWLNRGRLTGAVALAVAGVALAASLINGGVATPRQQPAAPQPSGVSASPSSPSDWPGPLHRDGPMPTVSVDGWTEHPDAAVGGIDIVDVLQNQQRLSWSLELRQAPPRASTLDRKRAVIEYGLVVDSDGDRVADCQIGINNDAPRRGDYRVWVTNLRTGVTDERVGPPYGYPVEFVHPDEDVVDPVSLVPTMRFVFLAAPLPCESFERATGVYAWASITDAGRVVAWDVAPDAAWLATPW
jgi:hypothetical protein